MAGPGKVGLAIEEKYKIEHAEDNSRLSITFNDSRPEPLNALKEQGYDTIHCDIRDLGRTGIRFDIITVRYGLKDLPIGEAEVALKSIFESLVSGGRVVLGEMMAYSENGQKGIMVVHGAKQILAGRSVNVEGNCYIPLMSQWQAYLSNAGFKEIEIPYRGYSQIKIEDYRGQFGQGANDAEMLQKMREVTKAEALRNPKFQSEAKVCLRDGDWHISYPILAITAVKRD